MSGTEWRSVFSGDNTLWTLTWRLPGCCCLLYFKRPECLDGIWSTFFRCDACCKWGKKTALTTRHISSIHLICVVLYLKVHRKVTLSRWGHLHPCKNDFEINNFQANTGVNILWFYSTLFVLVCDNQAIGKQLSIIHICSTGSSKFIRMVKWQDTY